MEQSLQLKLTPSLTMTPQLQQAIRLLQLSALDLQTEIQTLLETNPLLELSENSQDPILPASYARASSQQGVDRHNLESLNTAEITLRDHIIWQMHLTPFGETEYLIALAIIDSIDDSGFLTCSLEDIVTTLHPSIAVTHTQIETVLHQIQHFEPLGIGARNLQEYLTVQLDQLPLQTPWRDKAKDLVAHYLPLLEKHNYVALRRRLGLTLCQLQSVIQCIQTLNPRPYVQRGGKILDYVVPDVYTYKKGSQWSVALNTECPPPLQINAYYAALIQRKTGSMQDHHYLRSRLQEAQWFLKGIQNRNETLLKVTRCIVAEQQDFLEQGEQAMKPLVLHDIATALSLHESTISRITTEKYLQTPRGTFELKYFFSSNVSTHSSTAIRAWMKKWIAAENKHKPYSDNQLTQLFFQQGIFVARRTVSKYRESLQIPPSHERKQRLIRRCSNGN